MGRGRGSSRMANGRLLFLLQCAMATSQVLCSHHTPAGPTRPHRCSPKWTQTGSEPGNVYRQKGPQQGGGLCNGHRAGGAGSPRLRGTSLQQQSPRRQATFAAVPGSLTGSLDIRKAARTRSHTPGNYSGCLTCCNSRAWPRGAAAVFVVQHFRGI